MQRRLVTILYSCKGLATPPISAYSQSLVMIETMGVLGLYEGLDSLSQKVGIMSQPHPRIRAGKFGN